MLKNEESREEVKRGESMESKFTAVLNGEKWEVTKIIDFVACFDFYKISSLFLFQEKLIESKTPLDDARQKTETE